MKLVLLSGGSGKRLWPLSNDSRSKQFLKVLINEHGEHESMVQRVWRQLHSVGLADSAYIATSKSQVEMMHNQLGDHVPIIVEPSRRDTYPAIALAATYLYSMTSLTTDEVVTVLPVDPFVENTFFEKVRQLEYIIHDTKAEIALMGVRPTHASEKYGYIVPRLDQALTDASYLLVNRFEEKPTEAKANQLIQEQALWNCGVFAFRLGYIIEQLVAKGFPIQYQEMRKHYDRLMKISFDYEVVEKADQVVVLPYEGYWKDLGTWNTLTEEMGGFQLGKGIISGDSRNSHLINELDIPVAVLGLPNIVVAASPDGILVTDKDASPRIKEITNTVEQRLMYEERRWGWYKVLDYTKYPDGNEVLTRRIHISAKKNLSYHEHKIRTEIWTVLSGTGEVMLDEQLIQIRAGDVLTIQPGTKHAVRANTDLEMIEVQSGTELLEEDIHRHQDIFPNVEIIG